MDEATKRRLGRHWIYARKSGGWRFGMATIDGRLWKSVSPSGNQNYCTDGYAILDRDVPDPEHPGNIGFLLDDVRKAWNDPHAAAWFNEEDGTWVTRLPSVSDDFEPEPIVTGATEFESLLNALRSAA